MGFLSIKMWGSFPSSDKLFSAQTSDHVVAVDNAIKYWKETALPAAIANDKACAADGVCPDDRFKEADIRELLR